MRKTLSDLTKQRIKLMKEMGYCIRYISDKLGINKNTVLKYSKDESEKK